ncbi:tetratricopeptide repeat protein [Halovulum dunhuangense]|uniref:Tetratricopeptide repeat protein n=1 Tax=Halovulum dunhuangense TaxID=1505036 RepID=A0A849KY79_9RHOB|nr:tetratricopeptide repeat protein [Halovulum dunhuangense]NNU78986.1 tetratricopeptide repeat protein [Halovulum dunhuangense]
MIEAPSQGWFLSLRRSVMVVDLVESVRLIEADQIGTITRWREVVAHAEAALAATGAGRMVKSLGDGMLLDLEGVEPALAVAFALLDKTAQLNRDLPPQRQMHLRIGLQTGDLMVDRHDVYGHDVNVAARLAALGDPGDVVVSALVRDEIVHGIHADIEDLGECFLKHVREPVRAYRLSPPGQGVARPRVRGATETLLPTIAVIPLAGATGALGQVMAEEMIRAFGQSPHLNVISRLSTAPFARLDRPLEEIGRLLGASHVLTGRVTEDAGILEVTLELTELRSRQVMWSDRFRDRAANILIGEQEMFARIAEAVGKAILSRELQRARNLPVRTLESYTLMLAAVNAMYRLSQSDFNHAEQMLTATMERNPRHSVPLAWMGNWHVLKVQQGWTDDPAREQRIASDRTARALDLNPDCEHALTIDGLVQTNLSKDFEGADTRYRMALGFNPNNALANLLKGVMHAFRDEGDEAVRLSEMAQAKSPFDPQQYYFDCLTAAAYIAAGRPAEALPYAERSLKANSTHTSTLRTLAIAQWQTGDHEAARATLGRMMALEPGLTVSKWTRQNPAAKYVMGRRIAEILREAGMPE